MFIFFPVVMSGILKSNGLACLQMQRGFSYVCFLLVSREIPKNKSDKFFEESLVYIINIKTNKVSN